MCVCGSAVIRQLKKLENDGSREIAKEGEIIIHESTAKNCEHIHHLNLSSSYKVAYGLMLYGGEATL